MPDLVMMAAITSALRANEIGDANPYQLSFARTGASGASFGIFQADTAANPSAAATLRAILTSDGQDNDWIDRVLGLISVPCPVDPLDPDDEAVINAALGSLQGKVLVNALDTRTLSVVCADLDLANTSAKNAGSSIAPEGQLAICLWCNMTGQPTLLLTWLGGASVTEGGVAISAPGSPVQLADIQQYLAESSFFRSHPQNWAHFAASVATGAKLLPPSVVSDLLA